MSVSLSTVSNTYNTKFVFLSCVPERRRELISVMISVADSPAPQSDCSCDVLGKFIFVNRIHKVVCVSVRSCECHVIQSSSDNRPCAYGDVEESVGGNGRGLIYEYLLCVHQ